MPPFGEDDFRAVARRHIPRWAVEAWLAHAMPSVALATRPLRPAAGHESRLGGRPKVEPGFDWPSVDGRPLCVVSVLDLNQLGDTDPEQSLPTSGYLNVFFDARSPDLPAQLCEPGRFLVSHVDAPLVEERPTPAEAVQYPAVAVEPVEQLSVPHPREPELAELVDRYRSKLQRAHDDYLEAAGVPRHRLFGWPDLVGEPIRPHLPKLRGRTSWRLLGQFDSDDELEWSWGNMGRLYVFVPGSDLRRGRLDRCRVVLQSY